MKRFLIIPDLVKEDEGQEVSILINLDSIAIADWCLELCLLNNRLVENLTISDKESHIKMRLITTQDGTNSKRATVSWNGNEALIQLSDGELAYWLIWSLKYYRDGIADVNHIDVEIAAHDKSKRINLTLMVNNSQPSVSEEEARRRIFI